MLNDRPMQVSAILAFVLVQLVSVALGQSNQIGDHQRVRLEPLEQFESSNTNRTPVIFWHGMGDTARGSVALEALALKKRYPGIQVYSIGFGKSAVEDEAASYFANVNKQVDEVCAALLADKDILKAGQVNGIGFSQGAQFMRALVQRCPLREKGVRFKNLISLGGQHQGVYGLPKCNSPILCNYIRYLLNKGAYLKEVQDYLVQAQYWHDPLDENQYKEKNIFLADVNNERNVKGNYKSNLMNLDNFVLVKFEHDEMVIPRESSHFEFYTPGQKTEILPLESSRLWTEDLLGLREMSDSNKLKFISVPGNHLQYRMSWFLTEIADKYLDN